MAKKSRNVYDLPMFEKLWQRAEYFTQHWFVRNMFTLQVGSFVGTFAQALSGVLLARILQPESYGIYALAFSLAGLTSLFMGAGVQEASTVLLGESYAQKDRERTQEMMGFLLKMSLGGSVLGLIFAGFAPALASYWYGNAMIGWYAAVVVIASIISSVWFSFVVIGLQIAGEIRSMALLVMLDQVCRVALSVVFAIATGSILGAMAGHVVGAAIMFFAAVHFWRHLRRQYDIFPSLRSLARLARTVHTTKYLSFTFWTTVDRNLGTLYGILPVLLTGLFVSTSDVTFFKLAFGYVNIAMSLLGPVSTLLNVEFPRMKVEDRSRLADNFTRVTWYAVGLSTLLTLGAIAVSPVAFHVLYGPNFSASVPYVFGLFAYGAFYGLGVGLGPMWRAVNQVRTSIIINIITLGIGIPLGLWLIRHHGLWGSVIMVTLWYTVSHLASFIYLRKALREV
jgi:O-antigen/teichoic acid export membrane protein